MEEAHQENRKVDLRRTDVGLDADPVGVGPVDDGEAAGVRGVEQIADAIVAMERYAGPTRCECRGIRAAVGHFVVQAAMNRGQSGSGIGDQGGAPAAFGQRLSERDQAKALKHELTLRVVERDDSGHEKAAGPLRQRVGRLRAQPLALTGASVLGLDHDVLAEADGSPGDLGLRYHEWCEARVEVRPFSELPAPQGLAELAPPNPGPGAQAAREAGAIGLVAWPGNVAGPSITRGRA